ncbi:MAG: peptide chain release factor 2 [Erysipelotrichaceae bacterium]|nr:peptide chain release factor 2 [Erysipelotrichaceae bacterium]MCR5300587.1 peptide chain release factor 2 [Erysipelotrichaceae bacterium]
MELYDIKVSLTASLKKLKELATLFDLAALTKKIDELGEAQNDEKFWEDPKKAQSVIREYNTLRKLKAEYENNSAALEDLYASVEALGKDYDPELYALVEEEYGDAIKNFEQFEIDVLLSDRYDHASAYLEIHPGAGGTEAQDWAEMLYRMYQRYAEKNGYTFDVQDYDPGDEAGMKSCRVLVKGDLAYGYLKGETGVHRLVRISPFDANARRHTSFASVEITPEIENDTDIVIEEKDIEVETMRSSGAGGQHINKTDSAVRIHHKPTGIVTFCQSERSQLQNKERAMELLKSKLLALKLAEQQAEKDSLKGEHKKIEWGSQIRSYVFCPYTLVKDNRTGVEEGNVTKVMDGDIQPFLFAYLKSQL